MTRHRQAPKSLSRRLRHAALASLAALITSAGFASTAQARTVDLPSKVTPGDTIKLKLAGFDTKGELVSAKVTPLDCPECAVSTKKASGDLGKNGAGTGKLRFPKSPATRAWVSGEAVQIQPFVNSGGYTRWCFGRTTIR